MAKKRTAPPPKARKAAPSKTPAARSLPKKVPVKKPAGRPVPKTHASPPSPRLEPSPQPALPPLPPPSVTPQLVLSVSFVRDGDEFLARLESLGGHITELKNRSLDQLLTLVAGELEDLLA